MQSTSMLQLASRSRIPHNGLKYFIEDHSYFYACIFIYLFTKHSLLNVKHTREKGGIQKNDPQREFHPIVDTSFLASAHNNNLLIDVLGSANAILPYTFVMNNTVIFIASIGHEQSLFKMIPSQLFFFKYSHKLYYVVVSYYDYVRSFVLSQTLKIDKNESVRKHQRKQVCRDWSLI